MAAQQLAEELGATPTQQMLLNLQEDFHRFSIDTQQRTAALEATVARQGNQIRLLKRLQTAEIVPDGWKRSQLILSSYANFMAELRWTMFVHVELPVQYDGGALKHAGQPVTDLYMHDILYEEDGFDDAAIPLKCALVRINDGRFHIVGVLGDDEQSCNPAVLANDFVTWLEGQFNIRLDCHTEDEDGAQYVTQCDVHAVVLGGADGDWVYDADAGPSRMHELFQAGAFDYLPEMFKAVLRNDHRTQL